MDAVEGRIHSFESCGMVDGPGLRFIVFLQGCPLRCLYCHNPDSWAYSGGSVMSSHEVVEMASRYRQWMNSSGGGITLSGGEPLAQSQFTLAILKQARKRGMHTALDTSGYGKLSEIREVLDEADLVIMDIKTPNAELCPRLCKIPLAVPLETLDYLVSIKKPLWLRHVVVPGLTANDEDLESLMNLVKGISSLERFEFLPFHKMGEEKWENENLVYTLKDTHPPDPAFISAWQERFREAGIPVEIPR